MINTILLKSKMLEKAITQRELAHKLGIGVTSIYSKVNGKKQFLQLEIKGLIKLLGLTPEETQKIFF